MRVLIVEDELKIANYIKKIVHENGITSDIANSAETAELLVREHEYDVILLDVMLPSKDGVQFTKLIRNENIQTPILMVTALKSTENKVQGLRNGADDYLTKPFEREELLARIDALARRKNLMKSQSKLHYGDLELNLVKRTLYKGGEPVELTQREFLVIECFMRSPEIVLTRTQILDYAWDMNFDPESNLVDVYVNTIRKKIDASNKQRYIKTIKNTGYILKNS